MLNLTIIVLTFNEERHIRRCLDSFSGIASRVVVVDSGSSDQTREIAANSGADVYGNPWLNYAKQFNWALDHCNIRTDWVMRLDADEIVTPALALQLRQQLALIPAATAGITINRQIHFMGKWIRHGAIYPIRTLRVWRNGRGRCENRWMDEHILVEGDIHHINADIADINLNNITWWINKHNHYASREAVDLLMGENNNTAGEAAKAMNAQAHIKRWIKHHIYAHLPLGMRALCYFLYRYFFRLGFLDGWPGLVFHVLQGLWYRFLVDVKVYELRQLIVERGQPLAQVVKDEYGYDIS
ncbi:glycosyltransferase family 2 protein [Methylovulum psychrotolerans]|uniref:Glycosyl transferase n=1 Tax=Methylovulum psychrotolerans TaxID=1704499 RepID=A0A1Z4BWL6_9GAMM|nr:glycosyltransferase family 2 protein [Methylovulum psychrotolerans]ASF45706.1 glycosyl transferase [Methylovulum psychrotolerans]